MGGDIWVESTAGKGSTFYFNIVLQTAPPGEHEDLHQTSGLLNSRTALIVDDHQTNRRILELKLKFWGMTPTSVTSGHEALELLAGQKFDAILVDLAMPGMDGVTLAREIRVKHQTPLLLLSCTGELLKGDEASLFEHQISKPIKHSVLFNSLLKATGVKAEPSRKPAEQKLDVGLAEKNPLRILMAEDNLINQKVGLLMLSRLGYTANAVPNGKRALEALDKSAYDVILMDIQMPEMNGIEATRIVRETYGEKSPVIIALTAEALEGDEDRILKLGFDAYLAKPLQAQILQKMLEAVVPRESAE